MIDVVFWLVFVVVLGLSVLFHELGHLYYFRRHLGKRLKVFCKLERYKFKKFSYRMPLFEVGTREDYRGVSNKDYLYVLCYGVFFGTFPIIVATVFLNFFYIFVLLFYLSGCKSDSVEILRYVMKINKTHEKKRKRQLK